jgi:hypothetical protein
MAIVKALTVASNGDIQVMQSGDSLGEVNLPSALNGNAGTLVAGTPIYHTTTANNIDKARANARGTMPCDGIIVVDAGTGTSAVYQDSGILSLSTAQWDTVTGQTGGLTAGSEYFVDPATAGKLTITAPTTTGQFIQKVGTASSTTELHIQLGLLVKL